MAKQGNQSNEATQPKHDVVHASAERVKPSSVLDEIRNARSEPIENPDNVSNHVSHI